MSLVSCANQPNMHQEKVCRVLRRMDILLHNIYILIMQSTNIMEIQLANIVKDVLLGKINRSPMYYGNLLKYAFPLIKLTRLKNVEKVQNILAKIEFTRDAGMSIINYFLEQTADYEKLSLKLSNISYLFHSSGQQAALYNSLLSQLIDIEQQIKGTKECLYGTIQNIKQIKDQYIIERNSIVIIKAYIGMV